MTTRFDRTFQSLAGFKVFERPRPSKNNIDTVLNCLMLYQVLQVLFLGIVIAVKEQHTTRLWQKLDKLDEGDVSVLLLALQLTIHLALILFINCSLLEIPAN